MALKSTQNYEPLREKLSAQREALAQDLRQTTSEFINEEAIYSDAVDQASSDADRTLTLQIKNRERDLLWQIDEALKRMDGGNYGSCDSCGDAISEARLNAFPFTTLCIDCKAELESEENRFSNRTQ
jgi:DnaK suppressor protein